MARLFLYIFSILAMFYSNFYVICYFILRMVNIFLIYEKFVYRAETVPRRTAA